MKYRFELQSLKAKEANDLAVIYQRHNRNVI